MKFHKYLRIFGIFIVIPLFFYCSSVKYLYTASPTDRLRKDIGNIIENPDFSAASWGIYVESLNTGEIIYKRNPYKLFMPASNMKLFTTAAALMNLGADYRYTTSLLCRGEADKNGILHSDIIIKGSGDPSFTGRYFEEKSTLIFERWADSLATLGIKEIHGDIIGDDSCFDQQMYGGGWEYDDMKSWYAAPVCGLSFNENAILITTRPDKQPGLPPKINTDPPTQYVNIINDAVTVESGSEGRLRFDRKIGTNTIIVSGEIAVNSKPIEQRISIENPALYSATVFKETLEAKGIIFFGKARCIYEMTDRELNYSEWTVLTEHSSPPMCTLINTINKNSHNFYADQILKTLGMELSERGSFEKGADIIREFVSNIGINPDLLFIYDGSGLSRHNLVMPVQIARLLQYMRKSDNYAYFHDSLPVAGIDGTIKTRMKYTLAEQNVHAKTGSIQYVRALSGYVTGRSGEEFAVSILVNHYTTPSSTANIVQDRLFILLANFNRE